MADHELIIEPDNRPRPLLDVAKSVGAWRGGLALVLTAGVTVGLYSQTQGDALALVLATAGPLVAAVLAALAAFGVVKRGEPVVTPLSAPVTADGTPLVSKPAAVSGLVEAISAAAQMAGEPRAGAGGTSTYPGAPDRSADGARIEYRGAVDFPSPAPHVPYEDGERF